MKLSFIVPVYNVKPYLQKCIDSLLHQDYDDYEIILVDDGSTDGSGELADELALNMSARLSIANQPIIQVIHQTNRGLSGARNAGIDAAQGDYLCFVDSDDYWEENVLGELMAKIEQEHLEVLRFKWRNVNGKYQVFNPYKYNPYKNDDYSDGVTNGIEFLNDRLGTACYAWTYILHRTLCINNRFTEGIYFEDTDWTPRMLLNVKRIASTDRIVYNYLVREGSITNALNRAKQRKLLEDKVRLLRTLVEMRREMRGKGGWFDRMIAATVLSMGGLLAGAFWKERNAYLKRIEEMDVYPMCTAGSTPSAKKKIKLWNISPRMTLWLLHIKNK